MPDVEIADRRECSRYELEVDGRRVGLLDYRLDSERITFTHAEIDPEIEGQGLGSRLAAFALDDARERGLAVVPMCPFVADYISRNREYEALVPDGTRSRL